ncbi:MAG: hypothetical protein E3K36_11320 [Candidatus Brocadia sp.]|nr:hypothetical protein [Candidatus Brocadia sp.]
MDEIFKRYLRLIGINKRLGIKRHGSLIPVSPRRDSIVKGHLLLAGDAAGFADPVTGEGITFAILSGQISAKALLTGNFEESHVKQAYHAQLAKTILPELRLGGVLAKLIYNYPGGARGYSVCMDRS